MRRRLLLFAVNRASSITTTPPKTLPLAVRLFSSSNNDDSSAADSHADYLKQLQELNDERQALFGFTKEEEDAWQNPKIHSSTLLDAVEKARQSNHAPCSESAHHDVDYRQEEALECTSSFPSKISILSRKQKEEVQDGNATFTHLDKDTKGVNMVDVGGKQVTARRAKARTTVVFPPEVMAAFEITGGELVGPKGPIFATAKIAGIMAAK